MTNQVPAEVTLYLRYFGAGDVLQRVYGPEVSLRPGDNTQITWLIPDTDSYPIAEIGLEVDSATGQPGTVYLDKLTWSGAPCTTFTRPKGALSKAWRISWINAASDFAPWGDPFRVIQDEGTGLLIQGTADWQDYRVETVITPHMVAEFGLAARVQGLLRYYAVVLGQGGKARLVKVFYDKTLILGEADFAWEFGKPVPLALEVKGPHITAFLDGKAVCSAVDAGAPFLSGGIALLVTEGRAAADSVSVQSL
jgi:hypothetical protein